MKTTAARICQHCRKPLPVHTFKGAHPARQAVFVLRDGRRLHVECALALKSSTGGAKP